MHKNSEQQPEVYRHTRTSLKIRSTPTDGQQKTQIKEWMPEKENAVENSQDRSSSSSLTPPLPTLDLPNSENFSENRDESS